MIHRLITTLFRNAILLSLLTLNNCYKFNNFDSTKLELARRQVNNIQLPKLTSKYIVIFNDAFENIYSSNVDELNIHQSLSTNNGVFYNLDTDLSFSSVPLLINKNSDAELENITINVSFNLRQTYKATTTIVFNGNFTLQSASNIVNSSYANYVENEDLKIQLIKQAASNIHKRLISYFLKQL